MQAWSLRSSHSVNITAFATSQYLTPLLLHSLQLVHSLDSAGMTEVWKAREVERHAQARGQETKEMLKGLAEKLGGEEEVKKWLDEKKKKFKGWAMVRKNKLSSEGTHGLYCCLYCTSYSPIDDMDERDETRSLLNLMEHLDKGGPSHENAVRKRNLYKQFLMNPDKEPRRDEKYECKLCGVKDLELEEFKLHLSGEEHKANGGQVRREFVEA